MWISEAALLRVGVLAAAATTTGCLLAPLAQPPAGARQVLGQKGRRRSEWLAAGPGHRWLLRCLSRLAYPLQSLPLHGLHGLLERAEASLVAAGHPGGWTGAELVAAVLISLLVHSAGCWVFAGELALPGWICAAFLAGGVWPWWRVRDLGAQRALAMERSLPAAMDLVSLCMRSGADFPGSLGFVVAELGSAHRVCRTELKLVLEGLVLGRSREQALNDLAARVQTPSVREWVAALVQAERRGVPLADALAEQANALRRRRSVRAEEAAAKAGVRMVLPLMLMLGSILAILIGPFLVDGIGL